MLASPSLAMRATRRPNPVFGPSYEVLRGVLKAARLHAGLSQRQLAARLGVSPSHVARIEGGQRRIDVIQFIEIAWALGLAPARLFEEVTAGLAPDAPSAQARAAPDAARRC